MASLAMHLPVFIASPGDVRLERDVAERALLEAGREAWRKSLLVHPVRWEYDAGPGTGRPQDLITERYLEISELAICIIGGQLGTAASVVSTETGTEEELRVALDLVNSGVADDVFLYFRNGASDAGVDTTVTRFRAQIQREKKLTYWSYSDPADFERRIRIDIGRWIDKWSRVPEICEQTLKTAVPRTSQELGENRHWILVRLFDPETSPQISQRLGKYCVAEYQQQGPGAANKALPSDLFAHVAAFVGERTSDGGLPSLPLALVNNRVYFAHSEWFYYFCARGLVDAICADDFKAVERTPFLNPVHQYLSVLAERDRPRIVSVLVGWLLNDGGKTTSKPVVRNFAAYALGMLKAKEAEDALAKAMKKDRGQDVQLYCIASLAKIRSRRYLPALIDLYFNSDSRSREMLGQAICRIVGIAEYEL